MALMSAPPSLTTRNSSPVTLVAPLSDSVPEGNPPGDGNVVEAEVPDAGVEHAVGAESHCSADESTGHDIVPVVVFVDRQSASNQSGG